MFKVNNKNSRTTRYQTYFTPFSSASIVDFEQENVCWDYIFMNVKWPQLYF